MTTCLAATGPIGAEALLVVAIVLLIAGVLLARRARTLAGRGAMMLVPLLLAAVVLSGAPAAPALADQHDCPPMQVAPDAEEPGTDDPGTDEPGEGVVCEPATSRAVAIEGLFREPEGSRDDPFTDVRFTETVGEELTSLVDEISLAGLTYDATASVREEVGAPERSLTITFDASGAFADVVVTGGAPLPRTLETTLMLTVPIALPAAEGCEASTIDLTLDGFLIEAPRDFTPIDPCETDQITAIDLSGSWIQQQGSASLANALLVGFMSYTAGGPEDAADLVARGTLTNGYVELTLSDGSSEIRPIGLVSFFTPAGEVQIGGDVSTPDGIRVTAIEAVFTYTVPGLPDCDPDLVFVTFTGPANLDTINT